ncbi:MAG: hypothetical protein GXO65_00755, partial [Euryarchaeota archaeon]|nr:hypothetical protein [Euryarchaeota archaeon]
MSSFGWDIKAQIDKGKIRLLDAATPRVERTDVEPDILQMGYDIESMVAALKREIQEIGAKRAVVDSISIMSVYYTENEFDHRTKLLRLSAELSKLDVTTLIISEA